MNGSNEREELVEKHERFRAQRILAVKRWVNYIEEHSVEEWGAQQNALVNSQIESAQASDLDAAHYRRVKQGSEQNKT